MLVGSYVGIATVGVFCSWYLFDNVLGIDLSADGHSTVTWYQLRHWEQCDSWTDFKARYHSCTIRDTCAGRIAYRYVCRANRLVRAVCRYSLEGLIYDLRGLRKYINGR